MKLLEIPDAAEVTWDVVSLGEVMLRLDPGDGRVATARSFRVWEGGGEYNVARGLRKCFGLRTAVVTALVDNPVGRLIEDCILQGGVDTSLIVWVHDDGAGRQVRNGLNFTERGFGVRGAVGCSDRGNSAASQLRPGAVDWPALLSRRVRWLHCGGIFASLSDSSADFAEEAMAAARAAGIVVSYDLNYRPSLWKTRGGVDAATTVNRRLVSLADVVFGNEEDFHAALGYPVEGVDDAFSRLDPEAYAATMRRITGDFPNLRLVASSLRVVTSATVNDWGGICFADGEVTVARLRPGLEVYDRVGGGDSFASGVIYGVLAGMPVALALEYGVAHGALAMTTPGDTSMASLREVESLVGGGSARVER